MKKNYPTSDDYNRIKLLFNAGWTIEGIQKEEEEWDLKTLLWIQESRDYEHFKEYKLLPKRLKKIYTKVKKELEKK